MRAAWCLAAVLLIACGDLADAQPATRPSPIAGFVSEAAQKAAVPETWIWALMRVESGGDMRAVSRAGAMGLMQLMPSTWIDMRARLRLGDDPFDPHDNILAGAFFLRAMYDRYGAPGFLAAYNAGPGRYEDYLYRHRALPVETTAYVTRLGPTVGGAMQPDPNAWTRASLFVGTAPDKIVTVLSPANDKASAAVAPAQAPSDRLFIRASHAITP
jgi:soluble lytic murein transglycosylase-like protein